MAAINSTVIAVKIPRASLRLAVASNHCPATGAVSATTSPAAPNAHPSQALGEIPPGRFSPTLSVRYTENTNVRITALNDAAAQSQNPHAHTTPRPVA